MLFCPMEFTIFCCETISGVGILWVSEAAKVVSYTVFSDAGSIETFRTFMCSFETTSTIGAAISAVLAICSQSKIRYSVIISDEISMVNLGSGPLTVYIKPSKSVRQILFLSYPYIYISRWQNGTSGLVNFTSCAGFSPSEFSRIAIVLKDRYQVFMSNLSHLALQFLTYIGGK